MVNKKATLDRIVVIQEVLDRWRTLGSQRLANGTELIGRAPIDDSHAWLHVLFPPATDERLAQLEAELQRPLPPDLRNLYRRIGGMSLFTDSFVVGGPSSPYVHDGDGALKAQSLVSLNHELAAKPWMREGLFGFATNSWDRSIHVYGYDPAAPDEVVRLDRTTGALRERHEDLWSCIVDRLIRLDALQLE